MSPVFLAGALQVRGKAAEAVGEENSQDAGFRSEGLLIACNWSIMILVGLFNYLNSVPFPLTAPESMVSSIGLVLWVLPLAWLQWHFTHRLIYALLVAVMMGLFVDLNDMPAVAAAILIPGLGILGFFARHVTARLCFAILATVFAWQCLTPWIRVAPAEIDWSTKASNEPALLHIIFDSYTGLDGLAVQGPMASHARQSVMALAANNGLEIVPHAFGRHPNTINSLAEILSLGEIPPPRQPMRSNHIAMPQLSYLRALKDRGYAVHVIQTDFIDLCAHNDVQSCRTVHRSDLSALRDSGRPLVDRVHVMLSSYLNFSGLTALTARHLLNLANGLGYADQRPFYQRTKLFSVTGARELDRLSDSIRSIASGNAAVVHVLLPHDPYAFAEDCTLLPPKAWRYEGTGQQWRETLAAYDRQLVCTNRKITDVIANFRQSTGGRNGLIVIHGDHGARVAERDVLFKNGEVPARDDLVRHYSALFAVSSAALETGQNDAQHQARPRSISGLLKAWIASDFTRFTPVGENEDQLFVADEQWQPRQSVRIAATDATAENGRD